MVSKNPKNFEFKLGKQGFLLFAAGMSFLLFVVFIVGVMVGTHIDAYPEKIAQTLPAIIRRQLFHPTVTTENVVTVREGAKLSPTSEENNVVVPLPDPFTAKDDLSARPAGAEEKKAPPVDPEDTARTPQLPAAPDAPLAEAGGKYSVQVGSFKSQKAANSFCSKITALGFKPRVSKVKLPNKGEWFRVAVDGFSSRVEAQKAASVMAKNIKGVNGIVRSGK